MHSFEIGSHVFEHIDRLHGNDLPPHLIPLSCLFIYPTPSAISNANPHNSITRTLFLTWSPVNKHAIYTKVGKESCTLSTGGAKRILVFARPVKTCFLPIGCSLLFANNERTKTEIWQTSLAIQILKTIHTGACSIAQATIDCLANINNCSNPVGGKERH